MRVNLLGPVEVLEGGRQITLSGQRQRALLAALALDHGQVIPAARLVDVLWGEDPPVTARVKVPAHVSALRAALGPAGRALLRTCPPGYVLGPRGVDVDVAEFEGLTRRGYRELRAAGPAAAADLFAAALSLWRGPACADVASLLVRAAANGLEDRYLLAIEVKAQADLELGRCETVAAELSKFLSSYPLRERLRGLLMIALYQLGCRAEALTLYREGHRLLVAELGLEPGARLQRLHQRILADDPGLRQHATRQPSLAEVQRA